MAKKIYVGNMPFTMTEEEVRTLFSEAGAVSSVSMITDRDTGRSRGFGFVEMAVDAEADKAIQMFNGRKLGDRPLVVNEARPMGDRKSGGGGGGFGGGGGRGGGGGERRW